MVIRPSTPSLPALRHALVQRLTTEQAPLLRSLLDGLGSPLHLMLPQVFEANARAFQQTLREAGVDGQLLFAKKANKARCLVERCPGLGLGVDAASVPELVAALAAGVPGAHIGISGPAKHPALLALSLHHDCLVAMDSPEELLGYAALAKRLQRRARVLLRWRPPSQPRSRFGMDDTELAQALALCVEHRAQLQLQGFSFHLSGYDAAERARCALRLIERCTEARALGLPCDTLDIGGGFSLRYVEEAAWQDFMARQSPQDYHAGKTFEGFYPYASASPGAQMLERILSHDEGGRTLARRLREEGLRLLLEPGRALLDQAGFTLFRVQGVKDRPAEGYGLVTVEGMSFSLSEQWFNSEFLPDPLLLGGSASGPYPAAVAGASCLDSDMLSWRKLPLPSRPKPGDALVYLNTAGYQMDSNESPFHELPLPRKVSLEVDANSGLRWRLDEVPPVTPPLPLSL